MTELSHWRRILFTLGWILLALSAVVSPAVVWNPTQWLASRVWVAIWMYSGFVSAIVALTFVLFGRGWKRWILTLFALVDAYVWFSFIALWVQLS
jgi:hypothetical protein